MSDAAGAEEYAPTALAIDPQGAVVQISGRAYPYLSVPPGAPAANLFDIAHPDLRLPLRAAIRTATRVLTPVVREDLTLLAADGKLKLTLTVWPFPEAGPLAGLLLVVLQASPPPVPQVAPAGATPCLVTAADALAHELQPTRATPEATIGQLQLANAELQTVNAELRSLNESLRATNAQLQTVNAFADITTLKRAEAALQSAHDELEQRVSARTAELAVANAALQAQATERAHSEQARQQLLQQLVTAQEEERRHIARELHDQLGQDLTALILGLKALQDRLSAGESTAERVGQLQTMAIQISQEVRNLAVQLRPSVLDDLGLALALSNYVEQWSARADVAVDLHTSGLDVGRLPLAAETTIYRLVQEALTNVLKHAQASEVSIIVERHAEQVRLIIEDDGVGFSMPATWGALARAQQLGLVGMRERVTLLGGHLAIESAPGSGTSIFASIPLPAPTRGGGHDDDQGFPGR